jgi:tRNA pseudouridine55 synthase
MGKMTRPDRPGTRSRNSGIPYPGMAPAGDVMNSVLLIDKPEGKTSNETIREVERITGVAKIGHAGTLDRFASGLLVVCTGAATKLARYLLEDDKSYTGTVRLGVSTETDDSEGAVIEERPAAGVTGADILACARKFTGVQLQRPPRYSALKIQGRRASDRARSGEQVEIAERAITVHEFEVDDVDTAGGCFTFRAHCSKGTYIRSLARDMGQELGTGAHLERLRRTAAGRFTIDEAVTLEELERHMAGSPLGKSFILTPVEALEERGKIIVGDAARKRILNGAPFTMEEALEIRDRGGKLFIILDESENLIAIADVDIQKWHIKYLNVFNS